MLKLGDFRVIFLVFGLGGVLLFASPSFGLFLHLPQGEKFSELWLLGPEHMAKNYPYNVTAHVDYFVYLGVGNHMGSPMYYGVYLKFGNQFEPLPNDTAGAPSPLVPLYEYHAFVEDGKSWEVPLTFSFSNVSHGINQSLVGSLSINNVAFNVNKATSWNDENRGYFYKLFVELWIYSVESDAFQFHDRFVGIRLNMTGNV